MTSGWSEGDGMSGDLNRRTFLGAGAGLAAAGLLAEQLAWARQADTASVAASWKSDWASPDNSGRLAYRSDPAGNRIPDFSYAGYRNGLATLPVLPVKQTISPIAGDNTAHIQAAINAVGALPKDSNGHRGAVLLQAGRYEVRGTVRVNFDGVVLRGVGDGADPAGNTIIWATGNVPAARTVIRVGHDQPEGGYELWKTEVPGTRADITTSLVTVGSRTFNISATDTPLVVGDNVILMHPCTQAWLDAIDGGGTGEDPPWSVGEQPILYNRFITDITARSAGSRITIDAPVFNHLDRSLAQCYLYKWSRVELVTEAGVENLRVDIAYDTGNEEDENHAKNAIMLAGIQDGWIKNCTALHFVHAGVYTTSATRCTVQNCRALDPISLITGERRYNFACSARSQQILFVDCLATRGRHAYVSNGTSTCSGVVFLRCTSQYNYFMSEGHRRWSQGLLFDGFKEINPNWRDSFGFYNRGAGGTGHGWAAAHSVAWNSDGGGRGVIIQRPPTAQNWAVGCFGNVTGVGPRLPGPAGLIEGTGQAGLNPASLYTAQLAERRSTSFRHYAAVADAYVRGGPSAGQNFGAAELLKVKTAGTDEFERWTYLKFSLGGETAAAVRIARLHLYAGTSSGPDRIWVRVHAVPDTTWTESGVTWNNKPTPNDAILSSQPVTGPIAVFEWDVTSWVKAELAAGRTTISLALRCPVTHEALVEVQSRDHTIGVAPQILVSS